MGKRKKKRKNSGKELQRKEVMFGMPLWAFLLLFPGFPLPPELDVSDPGYVVRFRPMPGAGGGVWTEIGYEDDSWMLE